MIICTRCGASNDDGKLVCQACGRKLQSGRSGPSPLAEEEEDAPLAPLSREILPAAIRRMLRKGLEAWVYALVLLAAGLWVAATGQWLVLAPVVAVTALLAWSRKV